MQIEKRQAYAYVRVSTVSQGLGHGIARQSSSPQQYADAHGFDLVETIEDIGLSAFTGKNLTEGELGKLIERIESGDIAAGSVLLIESLDRLSRQEPLRALKNLETIVNSGVSVITLDDGQELTADRLNKDFASLLISLSTMHRSHQESALKSERLKSSWQNKRENASNKKLTSKAPAWLRLLDDRSAFVEVSDRADTVREIFSMSKTGYGSTSIQRHLNDNLSKHPPFGKSKTWNRSYVQKILENPAVFGEFQPYKMDKGKRVPDGPTLPDYFPAVVSKDDFLLSQAQISSRRISGSGRKGPQFSNLFTRLMLCGHCGGTIGFLNKGPLPKGGNYLRCVNASAKGTCDAPSWKYESFEQSFLEWITEINLEEIISPTSTSTQLENLEAEKLSLSEGRQEKQRELEQLIENIGRVDKELIELISKRASSVKKDLDELDAQLLSCDEEEAQLRTTQTQGLTSETFERFIQTQSTLTSDQRRDLRVQIHKHMRDQIEVISVFNKPEQFFAWDDMDEIAPQSFIEILRREGVQVDDPERLAEFMSTEKARRRLEVYERHFTVKFRNGTSKRVQPGARQARFTVSQKMAEMLKRFENEERD